MSRTVTVLRNAPAAMGRVVSVTSAFWMVTARLARPAETTFARLQRVFAENGSARQASPSVLPTGVKSVSGISTVARGKSVQISGVLMRAAVAH